MLCSQGKCIMWTAVCTRAKSQSPGHRATSTTASTSNPASTQSTTEFAFLQRSRRCRFLASYTLDASNPIAPKLIKFIEDALSTLSCPPSFSFHGEAWATADDQLVRADALAHAVTNATQ